MPAYFVTGTDTDAGKTLAACGLLALARRAGLTTLGLKPVASGSDATPGGLRNADALALQAQSRPPAGAAGGQAVAYATVNPYAFAPAIAPHLAARRAGVEVRLADLSGWLRPLLALECDLTLVEGAGGWRVPLSAREDLAGLAAAHALPVILVVGLRLGCISQARLTAEAIAHDGLRLAGWIGSLVEPAFAEDGALYRDNLATLASALPAPCLGVIPRLPAGTPRAMAESAAGCLELPDVH